MARSAEVLRSTGWRVGAIAAIAAIAVAAALLAACRREEALRFERVPVVLISIDTLRSDRLPAYGYRGVETPAIDAFRADSVLFTRAYSHVPMTLPAHVSMFSGTLPGTHGVRNNVGHPFDAQQSFWLPCALSGEGYAAGAAVSTYVLRAESGIDRCFSEYDDAIDPRARGGGFDAQQRPGWKTLEIARRWIGANSSKPFFYFFHIYEPHVPYEPAEPFRSRYPHPYDGEIAEADAIVGELLKTLRDSGIYDRAIIILLSDHGEGLGDHGEQQHSVLLNRELIQIPLVIKLPGSARKGSSVDAPVQLADVAPTILDLLGAAIPESIEGLPLFRATLPPDRPIISETLYPRIHLGWSDLASIIRGDHHYIDGPRPELYDLAKDFNERQNLVTNERRIAAALREQLQPFRVPMKPLEAVDPETARKMAALGYIGSPAAHDGPLPDPKEHIGDLEIVREALQSGHAGRHRHGIALLREMLGRNPRMVEGWAKLGDLLSNSGDANGAADAYRRAVTVSPSPPPDLLIDAGAAALNASRADEAEGLAKAAMNAVPTRAHELLARVALARGRFADAEKEARAAAGEPPKPSMLVLAASALQKQGRIQEALRLLEEAQQSAGKEPVLDLDALRGDTYMQMGEPLRAKEAFLREIANFPSNLGAWSRLCVVLHLEGDAAAVSRLLEDMAAKNPGPKAPLTAARTLEALGDAAGAARWRQRAESFSG